MAHNVKLIKNNIIRVSKVKYGSCSTQINEKNFEKNILEVRALEQQSLSSENQKCQSVQSLPSSVWLLYLPHRRHSLTEEYLLAGKSFCRHAGLTRPKPSELQVLPQHLKAPFLVTSASWQNTDAVLDNAGLLVSLSINGGVKCVTYSTNDRVCRAERWDCKQANGTSGEKQEVMATLAPGQKAEGCCGDGLSRTVMSRQKCSDKVQGWSKKNHASHVCPRGDGDAHQASFDVGTYLSQGISMGTSSERSSAVLFCAADDDSMGRKKQPHDKKGPNLDQLRKLERYILDTLPTFFKNRLDYRIYHPKMIFENNFWGKNEVFTGVNQYAVQMIKCRALMHLKYAHIHLEPVSSTCLEEEGIIRIQWRIVGLSQFKALRFWKYSAWNYSSAFKEDAEWLEGISILHVNKDGLVTKHRIDRMSPDEEQVQKTSVLAPKLALILGLAMPKPGLSDFSSMF